MPWSPLPVSPWRLLLWRTRSCALGWLLLLLAVLLALSDPALAADCPAAIATPTAEQLQAARADAQDHGVLWRLDKNGQVGWLYGTLHVGRLEWAFPGPRLSEVLQAADAVALELDLGDAEVARQIVSGFAALKQSDGRAPLPAALQARLQALAQADCLGDLSAQPALLQALTLSVLAARRDGLDPAYAQEHMLAAQARAQGKPVLSLETPATQLAALTPESPEQLQAMVEGLAAQLESGQSRRQMRDLAQLWARGDLARMAAYVRLPGDDTRPGAGPADSAAVALADEGCDCLPGEQERLYMRRVNDGRNPALADRIAQLLGQGRPLLAAVGALHMTGEQALPELLRQRGWTVTRLLPQEQNLAQRLPEAPAR